MHRVGNYEWCGLVEGLVGNGQRLTASDTDCGHPDSCTPLFQSLQERDQDAGAAGADTMIESDGTAIDVDGVV